MTRDLVTKTGILQWSIRSVGIVSCCNFDIPKCNYELCRVSVEVEEHIPEMWVVWEPKRWKIVCSKRRKEGGDNRRLEKLYNEDFMLFISHH